MNIGGVLGQARQRAGLSVAQVSQRTQIRKTIIESIEAGDYSACAGDFYARGHIRAIATVVGADPDPLIEEYDATCRAPGALSAVSLDELLTSAKSVRRHRPGRAAMLGLTLGLGLVVALGFVAYQFLSPPSQARPVAAGMAPSRPGERGGAAAAANTGPGPVHHAHVRPPGGLTPVSAGATVPSGGNPKRASLTRQHTSGGETYRPASHRQDRESVSGHRHDAGYDSPHRGHRRAVQSRRAHRRSHPDRGRRLGRIRGPAHVHARHPDHHSDQRHGRPSQHGHAQRRG